MLVAAIASHPPLGLMLMAAGDALLGSNHDIDTRAIGGNKTVTKEQLPPRR